MIRTKNEMRQQWESGDTVTQIVAYDMIDTMFSSIDPLSASNSVYTTVSETSSTWDPFAQFPLTYVSNPSSSTANGESGNWSYNNSTFYFCVTSDKWVAWSILSSF